jgi:hypothetical protein
MSILASTFIGDIKEEFEGGNSLSINWDRTIRRAVDTMLKKVRPATLKRRVPIYGGLADEVYCYYAPVDVLVPSDLYTNDGLRKFKYTTPQAFHSQLEHNTYTIEYLNGVRFIMVRHNKGVSSQTIDKMEALGTKTGGSAELNSHNYIIGSNSIQATFTDAGVTLSDTLTTSIDISDLMRGSVILPTYIPTADNLASIEVRLLSSAGNYYSITTTADSIGDYLIDGWNMIRFDMANASETGSPDNTAIASWEIIGTTESGTTLNLLFDKFTIQKTNVFYLEYFSKRAYINGTTGALWKSTIVEDDGDLINIDEDTEGILHYEACMLVVQSSTFDSIDANEAKRFERALKSEYDNYFEKNPSSERPVTYSISPEIDTNEDMDFGVIQDDTVSLT